MCFEPESTPPIPPSEDVRTSTRRLVLEAPDGNHLRAFEAVGGGDGASAVVVLPDVRGLFTFYEELAVRLAEAGHDAVAIDYFGRTAGTGPRPDDFPYMEHVERTTHSGVAADVASAVNHLRSGMPGRPVFTVGFCFGGSNSWFQAANRHGLAGVIGFYGHPERERPPGGGTVVSRVGEMTCPLLGLMAGDDPGIPPEVVAEFERALTAAGVEHELVTYPGAPHSFFDRRHDDFAGESADAWRRVLAFIGRAGGAHG
jgi:carboxymethylenebutenolidase